LTKGASLEREAQTDAVGRFELPGLENHGAAIAVYDKLPSGPRDASPLELLRFRKTIAGPPVNPLLVREIAPGETDVSLVVPLLGTLAIRFASPCGGRSLHGSAFWWHSNGRRCGSRSFSTDADGVMRLERMPL
jgi:hypothetical protein